MNKLYFTILILFLFLGLNSDQISSAEDSKGKGDIDKYDLRGNFKFKGELYDSGGKEGKSDLDKYDLRDDFRFKGKLYDSGRREEKNDLDKYNLRQDLKFKNIPKSTSKKELKSIDAFSKSTNSILSQLSDIVTNQKHHQIPETRLAKVVGGIGVIVNEFGKSQDLSAMNQLREKSDKIQNELKPGSCVDVFVTRDSSNNVKVQVTKPGQNYILSKLTKWAEKKICRPNDFFIPTRVEPNQEIIKKLKEELGQIGK